MPVEWHEFSQQNELNVHIKEKGYYLVRVPYGKEAEANLNPQIKKIESIH